ncbi:MAG: PIN domain-containing protein [Phenylobacterium sp.]|uniref:PIN domain-containing protein n=1 Tax=Phenylobacterium sp. TaxID=1871053 RepID=UPI001A409472|nr:PIN domain-containing protein [Phenylobacterium sp.]MBL8770367.1 PIN domain-containing protein [Phenylobacterium sp.]
MNLCLDTCVLVDIMRGGKPHYQRRLQAELSAGSTVHLSTIVAHELELGVLLSARPEHHRRLVDRLCDAMVRHDWTLDDAAEAAKVRAELQRRGEPLEAPDVFLAGQARRRDWTLVSANRKHFARISGLDYIDWMQDA